MKREPPGRRWKARVRRELLEDIIATLDVCDDVRLKMLEPDTARIVSKLKNLRYELQRALVNDTRDGSPQA